MVIVTSNLFASSSQKSFCRSFPLKQHSVQYIYLTLLHFFAAQTSRMRYFFFISLSLYLRGAFFFLVRCVRAAAAGGAFWSVNARAEAVTCDSPGARSRPPPCAKCAPNFDAAPRCRWMLSDTNTNTLRSCFQRLSLSRSPPAQNQIRSQQNAREKTRLSLRHRKHQCSARLSIMRRALLLLSQSTRSFIQHTFWRTFFPDHRPIYFLAVPHDVS